MFEVGNIVRGINDGSDINIRCNLIKGRVLELITDETQILIEVLEHKDSERIGICFIDENSEECFELISNEDIAVELKYEDVTKLLNIKDGTEEVNELQNLLDGLISKKNNIRNTIVSCIKQIEDTKSEINEIKNSNTVSEIVNKVLDELNLIKSDPKCKKVTVLDNLIHIYTTQIYIEDEEYPNGHFKMNEYEIVINLKRLDIKVFGILEDYNRESCWSEECPHPHISDEGKPCWGNTSAMLVDSMSNKDLYTTFMLVINFLETFNLSDVAGQKIRNWDFVSKDDDSLILDNPYDIECIELDCGCENEQDDEFYTCRDCGHTMCEECCYICDDCGAIICSEHRTYLNEYNSDVCDTCLSENYRYIEDSCEYIHNDDSFECDECGCGCSNSERNEIYNSDRVVCDSCASEHYRYSEKECCYMDYDDSFRCDSCDEVFDDCEANEIYNSDRVVCDSCASEHYRYSEKECCYMDYDDSFRCDSCNEVFDDCEANEIYNSDRVVCNECAEKHYRYSEQEDCYMNYDESFCCDSCNEVFDKSESHNVYNSDKLICYDCCNAYYNHSDAQGCCMHCDESFRCDLCDEVFENSELNEIYISDMIVCNKCAEEHYRYNEKEGCYMEIDEYSKDVELV